MAFPIIAAAAGAFGAGLISLAAFGPGIGDVITQYLYFSFQSRWYSAAELLRAYHKGTISKSELVDKMKYAGYSEGKTELLLDSYSDELSISEIILLFFRYRDLPGNDYGINNEWLNKRLLQAGVNPSVHKEMIEANRPVPTLQDIITFAIRDVFEPEQVALARLFEDLPDRYVQEAKKRGLSEEDAKFYWGAHWNLPGITQVYEMFHRLYEGSGAVETFTDKDMDIFFKLADIAPGFTQRLKAISYNPLTRVDIRRIYGMGIWGEGQTAKQRLIHEYRQLGYTPANAGILADFTIGSYGSGRKKFTQSQITKFYTNRLWGNDSRTQAQTEFERLGYDSKSATLILDYIDLQEITAEEQSKIDTLKEQWISGAIESEAELHTKLIGVPVTEDKANKLFTAFERERLKRQTRLSRSEIDGLYNSGIIDETQYRKYLRDLGYTSKDIDFIVKFLGKQRAKPTALPSKDDILGWYEGGIITALDYVRLMRENGFRDEFVLYYAQASNLPLDDSIVRKLTIPEGLQDYEI